MADDWARWQGQVIEGEFRLERYLGGSEHSGVFRTEFGGKPAALKLMPEQSRPQWGAELSHPNLIPIFATGRCHLDGISLSYVVMEDADEVLARVIPERALEPDEARETVIPVLDALAYLHREGIIHGRLKPSNIVSAGERLKISSDGLRRPGETNGLLESRGPYDAPELADGRISPAADVWSLGVTLVEMLTRQLPVKNGAGETVLPDALPQEFREIASHCLDPDSQRRWTVAGVSARLSPAAAAPSQVITMPAPRVPRESSPPFALRRSHVMAAAGVVLAGIVIFAGTQLFRSRPSGTSVPAPAPEASRELKPAPPVLPDQEKPSPAGRVRGTIATDSKPDILRKARDTIQGTVKIRVTVRVDSAGKVVDAKLDTPHVSRYFSSAALQAAHRWRFHPPRVEGRAVASSWVLEFDLSRTGTALHSREIF